MNKSEIAQQNIHPTTGEDNTERQFHELQTHVKELERQNEELRQLQEKTSLQFQQIASRYNELYDSIPVGYCTVSFGNGKILQANVTALRLLGLTREEIMELQFSQIVSSESRSVVSALLVKVFSEGEDGVCNALLRGKGHTLFWAHLEAKVSKDGQSCYLAIIDISERKRAEEAAQARCREMNNFKSAIEASSIVSITDTGGTILYANEQFEAITQYSLSEIIGQNHRVLNSKHHGSEFFQTMWQTISSGKIWRGEICNRAKDGSIFWVDSVITPMRDEHGKVYQYLCIRYDITERKQTEMKQLQQLSMAVNKTTNAIIITDISGHITWVNDGFIKLTGYSFVEAGGKRPGTLLQGGETDWKTILVMRNALHQGQGFEVEIINYTRDNKPYWAYVKVDPFWGDDGALMGYIAVHKDITKRKEREARLRFQAELLNSIGDAVIATDLQGKITYCNRSAEELYGWSSGELLGKMVTEIIPTSQNLDEAQEIFMRLTKGISWSGEFAVRKKDGTEFQADVRDIPLVDENGVVTGILGVSRNISEQKHSEKKLSMSEAQLRALLESSVQVHYIVDPDLRILAFNEIAAEKVRQALGKEIILGDDMMNYVLPASRSRFENHLRQALGGIAAEYQHFVELPNREVLWYEFRYIPVRSNDGTVLAVSFSAFDITERQKIEQSLVQYEQERERNNELSFSNKDDGAKSAGVIPNTLSMPLAGKSQSDYITIATVTQGNILLNARKEIVYLKGAKDYTQVMTSSGKQYLTIGALGVWEKRLSQQGFIRVHRSYIINIETIHSWNHEGNVIILTMRDGEQITVSRGYRAYFLSHVN